MIMPYISFNGNCEEAFLWYAEVFGGRIQHLSRYGDVPEEVGMPIADGQRDKVMHAQLLLTEMGGISGTDVMSPIPKDGAVAIHAHLADEDAARRIFAVLSEGGAILGELATNPPPDDHGVSGGIRDKYGLTWIISAGKSR